MRVAAVQITTGADIDDNLEAARTAVREAASNGARLIVLPEATSQAFAQGRLDTQAQDLDGVFATSLKELADELGVVIIAGMFRPADTATITSNGEDKQVNRVFNTALVTGAGHHAGYDKIHTYDAFNYRESDTVKPGEIPLLIDVDGITVGIAICYDIRFPELFKKLARDGAEIIAVPTSWADGPDKLQQWRILTAARALDSTAIIVAAGQARPGGAAEGGQPSGPTGLGHSTIVGPTGERLAEAGYEETILYADLDLDSVAEARTAIPVLGAAKI